jgi:hypothetical protein
MRLEGATICVGYGDFLAETLPLNRPHFDRLVVVTKPDDTETKEVCAKYDTECVTTHAFGPDGQFCKGAGINVGLSHLNQDGWVLHLDADTLLPIHARQLLERRTLDPTCIYGADRINLVGRNTLDTHVRERLQQQPPRTFGTEGWWMNTIRVVFYEHGGWVPCGFFQLWNPTGSGVRSYVEDRVVAEPAHAGNTDLQFVSNSWPLEKRIMLPELLLGHVESEQIGSGANWFGRKTRRLDAEPETPSKPVPPHPPADCRWWTPEQWRHWWEEIERWWEHHDPEHHHHHQPPNPYDHHHCRHHRPCEEMAE